MACLECCEHKWLEKAKYLTHFSCLDSAMSVEHVGSHYTHAAAGTPSQVVVSILPVWNSFAFFEVTPASFHQVTNLASLEGGSGTLYADYVPHSTCNIYPL